VDSLNPNVACLKRWSFLPSQRVAQRSPYLLDHSAALSRLDQLQRGIRIAEEGASQGVVGEGVVKKVMRPFGT
jgi:hypothetical protein